MRTATMPFLAAALLSACAPEADPDSDAADKRRAALDVPSPTARPSASAPFALRANPARPDRVSRYTRLDGCRLIEENRDEGGWSVHGCPGLASYALRLSEGDLRQNLVVFAPGGKATSLKLSEVTRSGGFSRLDAVVEWCGTGAWDGFRPDALVLRYLVVKDPDRWKTETAYLLAVRLTGKDAPCVNAVVPPGTGQNKRAREAADAGSACLK